MHWTPPRDPVSSLGDTGSSFGVTGILFRIAPRELPNASRLLPVTVYQLGKLHPPLGNIGYSFIDTGNSLAAPGSASRHREFLDGTPAPRPGPRSPFAVHGWAAQTIGGGSESLCIPSQQCVFVSRLPKFAPRLPKLAPKLPKFAPRLPKVAPRLPKVAPRLPKFAPSLSEFLRRPPWTDT
jgi:hypothetical protein